MRFPNGHKGVKKLFASEILNIAATLLFFATAVISIINSKKSSDDRYLTAVFVLLLFAGIVAIVSFLLQIIGINQARRDGRYFGTALIFLFAGIPADIVASVTQGTFRNIFSSINEVLTLLVTVYIILGIYDLATSSYRKGQVAQNEAFTSFTMDSKGNIWGTTDGAGFARIDVSPDGTVAVTHYNKENGLPSNSAGSISEDANGNLWVATSMGLAEFDPAEQRISKI